MADLEDAPLVGAGSELVLTSDGQVVAPADVLLGRDGEDLLLRAPVDLIAATTTSTGLKVYARLDKNEYPKKIKVTDEELAAVNITRRDWHPEWNYVITPRPNHDGPDP